MDLARVDTNTWILTDQLVEAYDSLIWTERYSEVSEFELKTREIGKILSQLPLESCVSLLDSKEVMIVEKHVIETDSNGVETLTVTGKSLTSFIAHRIMGKPASNKYQGFTHTNLAAAGRLLYDGFINTSGRDLSYQPPPSVTYRQATDAFPNTTVTFSTPDGEPSADRGPSELRFFTSGPLEPFVKEFLAYRDYGLRAVRPPHTGYKVEISSTGVYTIHESATYNTLCIDVNSGTDRSTSIVFDTEIDDLILPNYVMSVENFKNVSNINLVSYAIQAFNPAIPDAQTRSGIRKRWRAINGGQAEEGYTQAQWDIYNTNAAAQDMKENNLISNLIDGEVSPQARWKFESDYFLGDIVSIRGPYNPSVIGRVTEYIRAEDATGEVSYPSIFYI